ncbi:YbfB/YjiJ family MFS transporter [Vineibacter terrae]|uniref:YbfB/YjiJ family MFS transporter n=1 Tax=Vineibacter terrae TaxID=2586908 RepID=UPI002E374EFF|nr:YbfB/YjiJ family MFS transporter [Vineibacter terrae]HEX2890602.1 YbfB/YjiJ family MFS transporter [Vineibacter terrae]
MAQVAALSNRVNVARVVSAGLCASLVGIGLSRFAYTPLIPALVAAGWFSPADAAYLGAANLAGYLGGALAARHLAARISARRTMRIMLASAVLAFFACAAPVSFAWFFVWRFVSGFAGGAVMVLAATMVLPHVPPARRGLASGVIFAGVGLGIAASGTLVPPLLRWGLVETWCALGILALALTIAAWNGFSDTEARPTAHPSPRVERHTSPTLKALYIQYALNAVGLVPHMVFLVDFVARGLGHGLDAGARYWVLFGLGATVGPVLAGHLADRIGFGPALRLALLVQAGAIALIAVASTAVALSLSSLVVGAFVPGIVPLVLGRTQALASPDDDVRQAAWSTATTAFAVGQAGAAYAMSFLFAHSGSHVLLFSVGAAALVLALIVDVAVGGMRPQSRRTAQPASSGVDAG